VTTHRCWEPDDCQWCTYDREGRRKAIFDAASDVCVDFVYYDRKECESLPRDAIEEAIENGDVTIVEIITTIIEPLVKHLEQYMPADPG
jgi:hypothetical protein